MFDVPFILSLYPPDCRAAQIEPLGAAGGMSGAQFWRINAPRGALILRRWPHEHPTPDRLSFIHGVLEHAAQRDIEFVPVPIRATTGQSFVRHAGHLWELAPWMPGTADYEFAPSTTKLQAAMQALAKFHIALADFERANNAPSHAIVHRLARLRELQSGGSDKLARAISNTICPDLAPLARQLLAALPVALPRAVAQLALLADVPLPIQPCLRDIWHDHVLLTGNEVTGLIDFGAVDIDTPAVDVARLLGSLVGDDQSGWVRGIMEYDSVRRQSPEELIAARSLDFSGTILAGCNWLRWIYVEGRRFENHVQAIARVRTIVDRISKPRSGEST